VRTAVIAVTAGAAISGCESNPPEIVGLEWALYDLQDREQELEYEVLSLFVSADDVDGTDDLETLYIVNDSAELFWSLNADSWLQDDTAAGLWIGSTAIAMPARGAFPAGRYRVVLVDLAGDSTEVEFQIPARRSAPARPRIEIEGATLTVTGAGEHEVWIIAGDTLVAAATPVAADQSQAASIVDLDAQVGGVEPAGGSVLQYEIFVVSRSPQTNKQAMVGPFFWQGCRRAESNC
jgi:hypothetical protein